MVSYTREVKKVKKKLISGVAVAAVATVVVANVAHGLTYSQDIGVSFTFNPVVGLTLSASDLIISNLAPGTAADSNVIDINILTNNANGYTLNASVGNDSTYNTRNLVHKNNTVPNTFSSIDIGSNISDKTNLNDNTWAYSYSIDSGTTWTGYNGLPLYSDTTNIAQLKNSTIPVSSASGDTIKFKIAAKASTTQASGEYNNIINFQLTATPLPTTLSMAYANAGKEKLNGYYKLQDMNADICNAAEVLDEGSQMQAIDIRDNKVYWITKLRDGKCWFTQNLDLDLDENRTYTHDNTDLGWGSDTATTTWTPERSTINAISGEANLVGWVNSNTTPYSVDPGNYYWKNTPFYDSNLCYVGDDMRYCNYITKLGAWADYFAETPYDENGSHGHVGNYYNWTALIATNDSSNYTSSTYQNVANNPQNSICPAKWRLPTISAQGNVEGSTSEYLRLNSLYNDSSTETSEKLEMSPLYFVRAGRVNGNRLYYAGYYAWYWSSTLSSAENAYYYRAKSDNIERNTAYRYFGRSIRCVAR